MPIHVACPTCGARFTAGDRLAGKQTKCPRCFAAIQVGGADPPHDAWQGTEVSDPGLFTPPPMMADTVTPPGQPDYSRLPPGRHNAVQVPGWKCPQCGTIYLAETATCAACKKDTSPTQLYRLRRFARERLAFIVVSSVLGALIVMLAAPKDPGVALIPLLGIPAIYVAANVLVGLGKLTEEFVAEKLPDWVFLGFSWQRFSFEFLCFIGIIVGLAIFFAIAALVQWAFKKQ